MFKKDFVLAREIINPRKDAFYLLTRLTLVGCILVSPSASSSSQESSDPLVTVLLITGVAANENQYSLVPL